MDNSKPILFIFGALFFKLSFSQLCLCPISKLHWFRRIFVRSILCLYTLQVLCFPSLCVFVCVCTHANLRCIISNGDKVPPSIAIKNEKWNTIVWALLFIDQQINKKNLWIPREKLSVRTTHVCHKITSCVHIFTVFVSLSVIRFVCYEFFFSVFAVVTRQLYIPALGFVLFSIQSKIRVCTRWTSIIVKKSKHRD